jgi:hypothetical protein
LATEFTAFHSIFDNKVNKKFIFKDWNTFVAALYKMSKVEGYKPKRGERSKKKASPLISPAIFEPNTRRANDNVLYWSNWAALDIDEYEGPFENVLKQFTPYSFVCYSSASSTKEHPKFRVILQLTDNVPAEKIRHFWYAVNTEFSNVGDPQTKDLSRMYYVPAQYPNAYNFIFTNKGKNILSPTEIMDKHEFIEGTKDFLSKLPIEMQRAVLHHRKNLLTNDAVIWTSYHDCPFVNKAMLSDYGKIAFQDGTGRYSFFYKLMVNIAGNAIRYKYPITPCEVAKLMREIDAEYGGRYKKRPLETEASRAITYVIRNVKPF